MKAVDLDRDYHYAYSGYMARKVFTNSGPLLYRFLDWQEFGFSERILNIVFHTVYHDAKNN